MFKRFILDGNAVNYIINEYQGYGTARSTEEILEKGESLEPVSIEEVSQLINIDSNNTALVDRMVSAANRVRKRTMGDHMNIMVPLYITNICREHCEYCGFTPEAGGKDRQALSENDLDREILGLVKESKNSSIDGNYYQSIELVFSDDPDFDHEKIASYVKRINESAYYKNIVGLVGINSKPFGVEEYEYLAKSGTDIMLSWQETYNEERYAVLHEKCHKDGKRNFDNRLQAQCRAYKGGVKEVGLGALFGLYDYRFEVISMIKHARFLEKEYEGKVPLIGIPRIRSSRSDYKENKYYVSDQDMRKIVAVLRLALPYSHIFVSTREDKDSIIDLLNGGGGNVTASKCSVSPGYITNKSKLKQFDVNSYDLRDMQSYLIEQGFKPTLSPPIFDKKALKELSDLIVNEEVVAFIGSGFSHVATGGGMPHGGDLINLLLKNIGEENKDSMSLEKVATIYQVRKDHELGEGEGRKAILDFMRPLFDKGGVTNLHKMIAEVLPIKTFITTNYDRHLEDSISAVRGSKSIVETEDSILDITSENVIYRIHGSLTGEDNLVITTEDYKGLEKKNPYLYKKLNNIFRTKSVLFLGYGIEDENILKLILEAREEQDDGTRQGRKHYAVMKNPGSVNEDILGSFNIHVFNTDLEYFISVLLEKLMISFQSHKDVYEWLWEVREKLELFAVKEAVLNSDHEDMKVLESHIDIFEKKLESKAPNEELWEYDFNFHKEISKSGKNILLMDVARTVYSVLRPLSQQEQSELTLVQHKSILNAIRNKNLEGAERAICHHISHVKDKWMQNLRGK